MTDSVTWFVVIMILWAGCYSENQDFVMTRLGVKTLKLGKVALADDYSILSIFLKLPNITATNTPTKQEETLIRHCTGNDISVFARAHFQTTTDTMIQFNNTINTLHQENEIRIKQFIETRHQLLKPYFWHDTDGRRNKRQVLAMLASVGAGLAFGAITEFQMYKLKKHLSENENEINKLRTEYYNQQAEILTIKRNLISITRNLTQTITQYLDQLESRNFLTAYAANLERKFQYFKDTIDNILTFDIAEGSTILKPDIMDPSVLGAIVKQHHELNDTWFTEMPLLLYSISRLTLLDIDRNLNYAHFTLTVPLIYKRDPINILHRTSQVGTMIPDSNNTCRYFEIPEYILETTTNLYFSIDINECSRNKALFVCPRFNIHKEASCIQVDSFSCPKNIRNCDTFHEYKISVQGILIRNNVDNDTFMINETGWADLVKLNRFRVAYLPWSHLTAIQINDTKLTSPLTVYDVIPIINDTLDTFINYDFISIGQLSETFNAIIKQSNDSLSNILKPILNLGNNDTHTLNISWHTVVTFLLIALMFWVTFLHYKVITSRRLQFPLRNNHPLSIHAPRPYQEIRRTSW